MKTKISNIDLSLLLDISSKHINIYKALNNDSTNIDENIHNIFKNYTFVLNLLKKKLIISSNHVRNKRQQIANDLLNTFIEILKQVKYKK